MNKFKNVDELIAKAPTELQSKLQELRQVIKSAAPKATESISYGMAFYAYKGRLVYFGLQKKHIGLYIPPPIIEQHAKELAGYVTTKSAVHLSLTDNLPKMLITKLVRARCVWNEKSEKKRT